MSVARSAGARRLSAVFLSIALAWGCGDGASTGSGGGGGRPSGSEVAVVDVAWLAGRLGDADLQVVDARTQDSEFEEGHIPGAVRLDPYELSATVAGIQAQIASASVAEPILQERGIRAGTTIVVYGKPPEFDPARVVWALRYYGHGDVRYLDGGWDAWRAAGQSIESGPSPEPASDYELSETTDALRVTGDWILRELGDPPYDDSTIQIVDARSPGEYAAGRVPTAIHVQWSTNLSDGLFLPREDVEALHVGLDKKRTTVIYCLAGWRASLGWIALEWLGFEDVRVYDGSWFEWGEGDRFPIETDDGVS